VFEGTGVGETEGVVDAPKEAEGVGEG